MIRSLLPRRKLRLRAGVALIAAATPLLHAQDAASDHAGPDAVSSQLAADEKDKPELLGVDLQNGFDAWKAGVKKRTGLDFGIDSLSL